MGLSKCSSDSKLLMAGFSVGWCNFCFFALAIADSDRFLDRKQSERKK